MRKIIAALLILSFSVLVGCSGNSGEDKKLMDEVKILIEKKSFDEALAKCEELLKNYPESPLAMQAMLEMGKFYHSKAISGVDGTVQLKNAVNCYLKVYDQYPDSTDTPKALFYAGFLLANEIQNYDSAKVIYKKFIEAYPENELSEHVKYELQNIGLTPDEILLKNKKK